MGGNVLDLWASGHIYGSTKFVAVDEHADDCIMHQNRFGKANGFARQPLDSRSQR